MQCSRNKSETDMVGYACNPNQQEDKAGGLQVWRQPGLHTRACIKEKWKEYGK
jgi:hypothetical protein